MYAYVHFHVQDVFANSRRKVLGGESYAATAARDLDANMAIALHLTIKTYIYVIGYCQNSSGK